MELDAQLRAFAAFARQRSFSRAAEELVVSQPAVSKHIADLERRLKVKLVVREPKGCSLTPAGQFLAEYVLRAEALLAQAARGLEAFANLQADTLSLAASGTPGTYLLPPVLAAFQEAHPGVKIVTYLSTSKGAVEAVRSHRAEIGVVGGFAAQPELEAEPLVEDEVIVVGPKSLGEGPISRRELEALTWITREEGSATRAAVEAAWKDLGIVPSRRLEMPSWEAIKLAVASGVGVAACSRFAVEAELRAGTMVMLEPPRWNVRRMISVIRSRDAPLTPAAERFLAVLTAQWSPPKGDEESPDHLSSVPSTRHSRRG
jgi:DNA-binding transcriptional LysR family regulator